MIDAGLEKQRGNLCYVHDFSVPMKLGHVEEIKKGERLLRGIRKCGNNTLVNRFGFLGCFDSESHELVWAIEVPEFDIQDRTYANEIYVADNKDLQMYRLDVNSGEKLWSQSDHNSIRLITQESLMCVTSRDEVKTLNIRSKQDGNIIWSHESEYGYFGAILSENGILVVECNDGYHAFVEETGELLWSFDIESWQKKYLPDVPPSRSVFLRLLADGLFYLGFSEGYIAAVDVKTCEPHWIHQLQIPEYIRARLDKVEPGALLWRNGELLFTTNQGRGHISHLTILDAKTGELKYQANENVTPRGCQNPIIVNQYFIAGYEQHLSVFDIDKREVVWTYKYPKSVRVFGSPLVPFDNGLVVSTNQTNSLYWFKCKN